MKFAWLVFSGKWLVLKRRSWHAFWVGLFSRMPKMVFWCWLSFLVVCFGMHAGLTTRQMWRENSVAHMLDASEVSLKKIKCLILTLDESMMPVHVTEKLTCYPFLGKRFDDDIFAHVSPRMRRNLIHHTWDSVEDFTNNKSASIYWNHLRMWEYIMNTTPDDSLSLIIEDDCVMHRGVEWLLESIQVEKKIPTHNMILKLHNNPENWILGLLELTRCSHVQVYDIWYTLYQCKCTPMQKMWSALIYVVDKNSARMLFENAMPLEHHVDAYIQRKGCEQGNLFVLDGNMVQTSGRSSMHQTYTEYRDRFLLGVHTFSYDFNRTTCSIW